MASSGAKEAVDHWAQGAFKKKNKGKLHRRLGVKQGEKIPAAKMNAALAGKHGSEAREEAQVADNVNK